MDADHAQDIVALRKESVDRNSSTIIYIMVFVKSLSARRAWIEILIYARQVCVTWSLSARRAWIEIASGTLSDTSDVVALRKESVDRNLSSPVAVGSQITVALRKESVDRNASTYFWRPSPWSLSARRAWIEIPLSDS